ncbi:flagellar biosynthetic protein FliQ [Bradymonadaceae bacterium TMQ3]|nr:flagellar biosynthetic protein FliQ [Bradymonadaceae bacterium TMQ3]TXC74969.1 flagellar biosynthesis protein FliQ [Bradymonadales bacterium TMQ1]
MEDYILQVAREGLWLVLLTSAPPLIASMGVGLAVSVVQATTQIQEQTLTFVPKLIAVFASLAIAGPWIGSQLVRFSHALFEGFPNYF